MLLMREPFSVIFGTVFILDITTSSIGMPALAFHGFRILYLVLLICVQHSKDYSFLELQIHARPLNSGHSGSFSIRG